MLFFALRKNFFVALFVQSSKTKVQKKLQFCIIKFFVKLKNVSVSFLALDDFIKAAQNLFDVHRKNSVVCQTMTLFKFS